MFVKTFCLLMESQSCFAVAQIVLTYKHFERDSGPSCPGFDSQRKKLSMLLRLLNGTAQRKVDSGLKMLIEPI